MSKNNVIEIMDNELNILSHLQLSQKYSDNYCILERVNQRVQIDIIDMQEYKTKKYTCFLVYEDQFSKYIVLKALEKNCIDEVAERLIDIFIIIGIPQIVQSSNGKNYVKNLIEKIILHIPSVDIIYDNLMENNCINRDFKNLVELWHMENPSKQWYESLKYIQISENISKNVHNVKSPAAFIINDNILMDVKKIINSNKIIDKLYTEENNEFTNLIVTQNSDCSDSRSSIDKLASTIEKNTDYELIDAKNKLQTSIDKIEHESDEKNIEKNKIPINDEVINGMNSTELIHSNIDHKEIDDINTSPKMNELLEELQSITQVNITKTINCKELMENYTLDTNSKHKNHASLEKMKKKKDSVTMKNNSLLKCEFCKQHFNFPSVLKRHMRTHTNERPYVCKLCKKTFKQLGHLSQHLLTHTDYRSFQCTICGIKCQSLDAFKIHTMDHKEITESNSKLLIKVNNRLFECDNCKKVFATRSVLERHIFTHIHERQFSCDICHKRFKQAGHVKSHMVIHTGERKFSCTICSKRFSLSNALKKHMYVHNGDKPYQCDICGSRFLEKRNLNGHLMTHTNEKPFECKICGKRYTLADTLKRHVSAAHKDGRKYQCEICAKMFKQLAHLSVHKKVHTDERPFQCHLCEKNFKHKNVLKSHLAIHANIRPFECDICKSTFVRKTNLQTHITSAHMDERPYVCNICNKKFKQISHLNGHLIIHSNLMPYQCEYCEKRCNRLDNLKKHMKLHTKCAD